MKTTICYALLFVATSACAEVTLVKDGSSNDSEEYMAKVLSKTMIIDHMPRLTTRRVCEKVTERIHIDRHENIIKVIPNNMVQCRFIHEEQIMNVVTGYQVTYEYKGKIFSENLNYDPGDFIKVKN
jgi:uncharacterized protein YcfJ